MATEKDKPTEADKAADVKTKTPVTEEVKANEAKAADLEPGEHVNRPDLPEAIAEQHAEVDRRNAERNEANMEGHEKNMRALEAQAEEAQARTAHAADPRANFTPTGKEDNRNTPTVLPDGTKVW